MLFLTTIRNGFSAFATRARNQYLQQKKNIAPQLRNKILKNGQSVDMKKMVLEVKDFLFYPKDANKVLLFEKYFKGAGL